MLRARGERRRAGRCDAAPAAEGVGLAQHAGAARAALRRTPRARSTSTARAAAPLAALSLPYPRGRVRPGRGGACRSATLIVDDEPLARERIRQLLAREPDVGRSSARRRRAVGGRGDRSPRRTWCSSTCRCRSWTASTSSSALGAERTARDRVRHRARPVRAAGVRGPRRRLPAEAVRPRSGSTERWPGRRRESRAARRNRHNLSLLETMRLRAAISSASPCGRRARLFVDLGGVDWIRRPITTSSCTWGRTSHLLHVTMNALEGSLDPQDFLRVHRGRSSSTSGASRSCCAVPTGSSTLVLRGGARIACGRTYADRVRALVANRT